MNLSIRVLTALSCLIVSVGAAAQTTYSDPVKEGQQLTAAKKYAEAIEKYKAALTAEPNNANANYQMAYALYLSGKGANGIPYLDKAVKGNTSPQFTAGAYSLMGSIYGSNKQLPLAIEAYKNGIKADTANKRIYYNLGIVYYRSKLYNDAQQTLLKALQLANNYTDAQRMYALAAFHQNKRVDAVLGFCRFLQLEPNTTRSAEAFGNLQAILQGGALKPEQGYRPDAATKLAANWQMQLVGKALLGFATRRYASPTDLLTAQLKAIFEAAADDNKYKYAFANYYKALSQSDNMEAFARTISQKSIPENIKWLDSNTGKKTAYEDWIKSTAVTL